MIFRSSAYVCCRPMRTSSMLTTVCGRPLHAVADVNAGVELPESGMIIGLMLLMVIRVSAHAKLVVVGAVVVVRLGHIRVLHGCCVGPHGVPPHAGCVVMVRVWVPPPQDLEQAPHDDMAQDTVPQACDWVKSFALGQAVPP